MDTGFLIQAGASAVAITALVALAAWARIERRLPPLDEAAARALFAEEFPGRPIDQVWVAADGAGALARSGAAALVLMRVGDAYAARQVAWTEAVSAGGEGRIRLDLGDAGAPRAVLRLPAWPPEGFAA